MLSEAISGASGSDLRSSEKAFLRGLSPMEKKIRVILLNDTLHLWSTRSDLQREATWPPNRQSSLPKWMRLDIGRPGNDL